VAFSAATANIEDTFICVILLSLGAVVAVVACVIGRIAVMAGRALTVSAVVIHRECMPIDVDITPAIGIVALGALPGPMSIRSAMAGLAIILPAVIELRIAPRVGVMAIGALPAEVPAGPRVARLAVRLPAVIELRIAPRVDVMAVGALPAEVPAGPRVARLAVRLPAVVELHIAP